MNIEGLLASVTLKLLVGKGSVELSMMNLEHVPNSPPPPFPPHRILKQENQNPLTCHHQPAYICSSGKEEVKKNITEPYNHRDKTIYNTIKVQSKWKVEECEHDQLNENSHKGNKCFNKFEF